MVFCLSICIRAADDLGTFEDPHCEGFRKFLRILNEVLALTVQVLYSRVVLELFHSHAFIFLCLTLFSLLVVKSQSVMMSPNFGFGVDHHFIWLTYFLRWKRMQGMLLHGGLGQLHELIHASEGLESTKR